MRFFEKLTFKTAKVSIATNQSYRRSPSSAAA